MPPPPHHQPHPPHHYHYHYYLPMPPCCKPPSTCCIPTYYPTQSPPISSHNPPPETIDGNENCTVAIQDYYWRDYTHSWIPDDAVKGPEGKYIGQVYYMDNILPACIDKDEAITVTNGKRTTKDRIKILCSPDPTKFYWEQTDFTNPADASTRYTDNAIRGGYQDGYDTFIGKAFHLYEWKIGKVIPKMLGSKRGLQVWDRRNRWAIVHEFEILKCDSYCQ